MPQTQPLSSDIRLFLQGELVRRCKANPKYSLRAFARLLEIESSALSKILSGKRTVSGTTLERIARKLALSPTHLQIYEKGLVERRGRKKLHDTVLSSSQINYQQLALDHFQLISDWYHFAILELTATKGFRPNIAWIARSLGISVSEANSAVERLQRLEFLEVTKDGQWIDRAGEITNIHTDFTATAMRKLQEQILSKAITALEEVPIELRDNTGMTMAIDQDLLPEAKKRIQTFRRELCAFLQSSRKKDAVYHLGVALYPVTKINALETQKERGKK